MKTNDQLEPTVFVIFGGAGDLTWRKLVPALFDLSQDRSLPAQFAIIAVDRIKLGDDALRRRLHDGVNQFSRFGKAQATAWNQFAQHIHYQPGDFKKLQTYTALGEQCAKLEKEWGAKVHRIFYMATPPSMFGEIPKYLGKAGLARDRQWARIVIEKPIGYDLESARALNAILAASFEESQIFRIDHYLGKETVQNILAFRFANPLFEPIWNRRYVDYVTITVAEAVGRRTSRRLLRPRRRAARHGAEPPDATALSRRDGTDGLLRSRRDSQQESRCSPCGSSDSTGTPSTNASCAGNMVRVGSAAKKCPVTAKKTAWRRNPKPRRLLRSGCLLTTGAGRTCRSISAPGKRLPRQASEITIQFRGVPHQSFPAESTLDWQSSRLVMSIQPDEGIVLRFQAKHPGPKMHLRSVEMQFNYQDAFAAAVA